MATASEATTRRGFANRCPFCGEEDALRLDLGDVQAMTCSQCDSEVTPDDVRSIIEGWRSILAWLTTAPERD